jgi:hypothetical protein
MLATLGAMVVLTHSVRHLSGWLGERWGGLLVGLPVSTALTLGYCLWEHGPHYAARAAEAGLLGLGATVAFAAATAWCLSRSRRLGPAVAAGAATYVGAALLVRGVGAWLPSLSGLLSVGLLLAGQRTVRGLGGRVGECLARRRLSPARRLLLRTAIPVACLAGILLLAQNAEASWAGLFGAFPCTMLAMLVLTDLEAGPGAAVELLRTYPIGRCGTLAFLAAFALLTPALGPVAGYAVGYGMAGCVLAGLAPRAWSMTRADLPQFQPGDFPGQPAPGGPGAPSTPQTRPTGSAGWGHPSATSAPSGASIWMPGWATP